MTKALEVKGPGAAGQRLAAAWFGNKSGRVDDTQPLSELEHTRQACRKLVTQRAMVAAGAAMVPIPGLDVIADVALLSKLITQINGHFELSEAQIEHLSPAKRVATYKAVGFVGNALIGRVVTQAVIVHVLKTVGVRMTTKQVTKYVPIAGQAISAVLAFSAMRHVCHKHIDDCVRVRQQLAIAAN